MNSKILPILALLSIAIFTTAISAFTLFPQSIRLDEAQELWVATKPVLSILNWDATSTATWVPLYEIILHLFVQFFGASVIVSRSLSFIFFLATLPVLFFLYNKVSNKKIALLSIVIFSVSPFILWYGSEGRVYTMFVLISSINTLFFMDFLKSDGKLGKTGYIISSILGFYTHYFFFFLILTQIIYLFTKVLTKSELPQAGRRLPPIRDYRLFFIHLLNVLLAFVFFMPWIFLVMRAGTISNAEPLIPPPTSFNIFQTIVNFIFGFQIQSIQGAIISFWPLIIILLFFVFTHKKEQKANFVDYFVFSAFAPIMLVFAASIVKPIFLSRYLIFTTPSLFFLVVWMLLSYSKKISAILLSVFILVMIFLLLYQNYSVYTPVKEDYKGVTLYLEKNTNPSDIIAITAPFTIYPIEYYYTGSASLVTIPEWDRYTQNKIPPFSLIKLQNQLAKYKKVYSRIFIVYSYDQGYENTIKQYFEHHYKRLSLRKFSPGLEVYVYKLRY